jgi:hypothetical protein
VRVPRLARERRIVDDDELAWGVGRVGGVVHGGAVESVPGGFGMRGLGRNDARD